MDLILVFFPSLALGVCVARELWHARRIDELTELAYEAGFDDALAELNYALEVAREKE